MADRSPASSNRYQVTVKNDGNLPHWPEKTCGDRLNTITHYDTGRNKTKRHTALPLKAGGPAAAGAKASGIHWHVSLGHREIYTVEK